MKILVLAPHPFFQQRGTPIADRRLLEFLSAEGHEVDLLTFPEGEDLVIPRCRIHRLPRIPGAGGIRPGFSLRKLLYDLLMVPMCLRLVGRRHYDLVHAVEESAFIAALARLLFRTPFVYDMDSSLSEQLVNRFRLPRPARRLLETCERAMIRRSLGVLTVCPALVEAARRHDESKLVACVEDGTMLEGASGPVEPLRRALGITGPIVMYVGNLEPYQGVDLLLDSFARVRAASPSAHLVVIGGTPEHIGQYVQRAAEIGIVEQAHFLGPRPLSMLGSYLAQADLLVSPRLEGHNTPMKIYSYLDSGVAVLATRLPTHTQVLDPEIAALAAPDPGAFGAAMAALLGDAPRRLALGRRARQRAREQYTAGAVRAKLDQFYHRIGEQVHAGGAA